MRVSFSEEAWRGASWTFPNRAARLRLVELCDGRVTLEGSPEVLREVLAEAEGLRTGFSDLPERHARACLEVERATREALRQK